MIASKTSASNKHSSLSTSRTKPVAIKQTDSIKAVLRPKLKVGQPNDLFEQEADRVAEQVMRMQEPRPITPQGNPSISSSTLPHSKTIHRMCNSCEKETELVQKKTNSGIPPDMTPSIDTAIQSIQGGGQPLSKSARNFFEPRFAADFSNVRIHRDEQAASTARSVNARAFTLGHNVVFAAGEYSTNSLAGRKLLAHELTHVVQQEKGLSQKVQRTCGARAIGRPAGCTENTETVNDLKYLFRVNCDDFRRGNELDLRADAQRIQQGEIVEIHGYASIEGDAINNLHLSCARALKARTVVLDVLSQRGITATIRIFKHGATLGNRELWRSVVVTRRTPDPVEPTLPQEPERTCGPDVMDWFTDQIATAKRDRIILALRNRLQGAERVARSGGFSAERITEGAVAKRVLAEWRRQGRPALTPDAAAQITASIPGQRAFGRAFVAATSPIPFIGTRELFVMAAIRGAALTWKNLVGTGKKYDFKNRRETLGSPSTSNCPSNCNNTITLCPSVASNCFIKDVPGNVFYAHIGRFVGWTELTLQLGSQFAQLDSSASWDPPEDTRMINFAFNLPATPSRISLCSAINSNRSIFNIQNCSNCPEVLTITAV